MRAPDALAEARKKILLEGHHLNEGKDLLGVQEFLGVTSLTEAAELARELCNEMLLCQQPDGTFRRHSFLMIVLLGPAY